MIVPATTRSMAVSFSSSSSIPPRITDPHLVTVALLGPPNAGKSTLFNRLLDKHANKSYRLQTDKKRGNNKNSARSSKRPPPLHTSFSGRLSSAAGGGGSKGNSGGTAIVSAVPGTTRDRRECIGRIGGTYFRLIDTAGVDGERLLLSPSSLLSSSLYSPSATQQQKQNQHQATEAAKTTKTFMKDMMQQTMWAAQQADLIFLLLDARAGGVTSDLTETMRWLRKVSGTKPSSRKNSHPTSDTSHQTDESDQQSPNKMERKIVLLANKLEGDHWNYEGSPVLELLDEVTRMGFGEPIPISAEHGEGMAELAALIEELSQRKRHELEKALDIGDELTNHIGVELTNQDVNYHSENQEEDKPLQLAILGRQNVGKSTLVNALLKQDRVITGPTPGLTRDAIAIEWTWQGRRVQLVDTAGIRKPSQRDHDNTIEDQAVQDAMRAMKVADVAVLVLDAEARMLQRQELVIADAILKEGRALVVAANKMDRILETDYDKEEFAAGVRRQVEERFPMLRKTPIVPMSSLTGDSVEDLMPVVFQARDRWARKISTGQLNRWIKEVAMGTSPPVVSGRAARIKYIMQTKGRPPTFLLFCNTDELPESYLRYLTRHFQDTFEMFGMEVRLAVKKSATSNPYETAPKRKGSGIGGHEARKKRMIQRLQTTGTAKKKKIRRRKQ